jgi:ribosomal protein S18 acetylase RimI-like enzyme
MEKEAIRLSTNKNDIEKVLKVVSSFGADQNTLYEIKKHIEKELSNLGKNHILFILENSLNTLGVAQLIIKENTGHIHALQVDKRYHRKGFGLKIMYALEKHAKTIKLNQMSLAVESDNENAISLYKKLGYEVFDEIKKENQSGTVYHLEKYI